MLGLVLLPAFPTVAQDQVPDSVNDYKGCMALIEQNPDRAFDRAVEWRDLGGDAAAEHCASAALMALGYYAEAAERLEELAQQPTDSLDLRVELLQQAAQGWSLAEENERAYATLTAALQLDDDNPKLLLERAVVQAEMGLYDRAVDDLSKCLAIDPGSADAYAFRASAYRYLDRLDLAKADAEQALELEPNHLEARLERGIIRRLLGDDTGARLDWLLILDVAPDSPITETARRNIELLDIKPE